jgi:DNA helicase HerA-like ATPase
MILGHITGKTTTTSFSFLVERETKKLDFVQVFHKRYDYVLAQVIELEMDEDKTLAKCRIIGYKEKDGTFKQIRIPFAPKSEVLLAQDEFIKDIIEINTKEGAYVGKIEGKNIPIHLNLKNLLTKHIAILAKSGAGKSYTAGVLLEEIMDRNVPLLIIDPHGEYSEMKYANDEERDIKKMGSFNIKPKRYTKNIKEYGFVDGLNPIKLNDDLKSDELMHMLPTKLSSSQQALLYNAVKNMPKLDLSNLILELEYEESPSKYNIISVVNHVKSMDLFSVNYTPYNELIQPGRASIINLKGLPPEGQEILVYKLLKDLFEQRKLNKVPPFFCVLEEAHNFCPERGFGEAKSSKIIRTVASEGRKFGMGLCVITQRPARVDKSVLSQCTTQIILKVTNPNDLKAVISSVEGINADSENEIQNLPIGTSLITGVVDMPLFVNIRPRKTKHGGTAVNILETVESEDKFFEDLQEHSDHPMLAVVKPKITHKDLQMMSDREIKTVRNYLVPGVLFLCDSGKNKFNLLVSLSDGGIVTNIDTFTTSYLPELDTLSPQELQTLELAFKLKRFSKNDAISKTGNMKITEFLNSLVQKGYLHYKSNEFTISNQYVLSHLSNFAMYQKIEFVNIENANKQPPKVSLDHIKERLRKFVNVVDQRECFILGYDPVYA